MESENHTEFQAKEKPEKLPLRAKIPRASLGLNKRAVIVLAGILSVVVALVIIDSLSPRKQEKQYKASLNWNPNPNSTIQGLPSDYDQLVKKQRAKEKKEKFKKKIIENTKTNKQRLTQEEKILYEYQLSRIKTAIKARESDVEFKGSIPRTKKGGSRLSNISELSGILNPSVQETSPLIPNPRDDDNRQDDKENFLSANYRGNTHIAGGLIKPASKYEIMAGSIIPSLMMSGINSDLPGYIVGQVSQNIYDSLSGRHLLLPQGTKVLGLYDSKITYGQERVLIVWNRLILPNGKSISLEGMPGVDMSGYAGMKDKVNNHYWRLLSGVVFGSILGAGAQVAYGEHQNINPGFGQLAIQGAAQNINQAGQKITQKNLKIQPTLEIRPGLRFNIFVTKDITLEVYKP